MGGGRRMGAFTHQMSRFVPFVTGAKVRKSAEAACWCTTLAKSCQFPCQKAYSTILGTCEWELDTDAHNIKVFSAVLLSCRFYRSVRKCYVVDLEDYDKIPPPFLFCNNSFSCCSDSPIWERLQIQLASILTLSIWGLSFCLRLSVLNYDFGVEAQGFRHLWGWPADGRLSQKWWGSRRRWVEVMSYSFRRWQMLSHTHRPSGRWQTRQRFVR